jgi:hypothetical protein
MMANDFRQRALEYLRPEFSVFLIARVSGLLLRPLIIFAAGLAGRDLFAEDYALLITATTSLFVITGGQIHIQYYKRRFGSNNSTGYLKSYQRYALDSASQMVFMLPVVAMVAMLWTQSLLIIILILIHVCIEKFFDEDQRHFLFSRQYLRWSLSFSCRTILPNIAVFSILWVFPGRLILVYTISSVLAFAIYLIARRRHAIFYGRLFRNFLAQLSRNFRPFVVRWKMEYAYNQFWSFLSVNLYLIDRLWVANQEGQELATYVFFATLFNLVVVGHSMLYYAPRRPALLETHAPAFTEWRRPLNLLLPFLIISVCLLATIMLQFVDQDYSAEISTVMITGFAIFFYLQATLLVVVELAFWRVKRQYLAIVDVGVMAAIFSAFAILEPSMELLPWIMATGSLTRLVGYCAIMHSKLADRSTFTSD